MSTSTKKIQRKVRWNWDSLQTRTVIFNKARPLKLLKLSGYRKLRLILRKRRMIKTSQTNLSSCAAWWEPNGSLPSTSDKVLRERLLTINEPVVIVEDGGSQSLASGGVTRLGETVVKEKGFPIVGYAHPIAPGLLGDPSFCRDYGLRYPYVSGAMANGIGSADIVEEMGNAGMLGFFGAAGLPLGLIETAIDRITKSLEDKPYGFNLIHSPNEPELENAIVALYLDRGVRLVEASAYLGLTLPVIRYRVSGIHQDSTGRIVTPNRIIAKVSRIEVASKFLAPPPEPMLNQLVAAGDITLDQARLASKIPVAQDITVEADSGGHTDNQQAVTLLPTMTALRDRLQAEHNYEVQLRVGAGGGVATPASAAAFFSMGAAYIVTGTINQCSIEAGTSDTVREMLAQAQQADITMAPAADMFEMGVQVQVLKRGTMFAMRGARLYDIYRSCDGLDSIPLAERSVLEKTIFRAPLETIWEQTKAFFQDRDPAQVTRAESDKKHRMALVFRWYLGQSSNWANTGEPSRKIDYQIWCGPAMGAFNEWVKGTFLEDYQNRKVATIAFNILYGTAVQLRLNSLKNQGVSISGGTCTIQPRPVAEIKEYFE